MSGSVEEIKKRLKEEPGVLGAGWKEVDAFEDLDDIDEYESDEEDVYVVLDLGTGVDAKTFQAESGYQLIGMDTPVPFFKFANQIYRGEIERLIGDEVILGIRRSEDNPHDPDRPPLYTTDTRIGLRPITLRSKPDPSEKAAENTTIQAGPSKPGRKPRTSHAHGFFAPPLQPPLGPPTNLELEDIQRQLLEAEARARAKEEKARSRVQYEFSGRKVHPIKDREMLFNLDFGKIAEYARFSLEPGLAKELLQPDDIREVYSPANLRRIIEGRPLHGSGSREKRKDRPQLTGSVEPSVGGREGGSRAATAGVPGAQGAPSAAKDGHAGQVGEGGRGVRDAQAEQEGQQAAPDATVQETDVAMEE